MLDKIDIDKNIFWVDLNFCKRPGSHAIVDITLRSDDSEHETIVIIQH